MARQADLASQTQNPQLRPLLQDLALRIHRGRDRPICEADTKTKLINPVLDALGWDVQGDDVEQEFKNKSIEDPVDYALKSEDGPVIVVEAKALGVNLADPKWIGQLMKYASMAGVEWGVLTNGDEYRLYNTTAKVPVDEKLFFLVCISEEQGDKAVMMLPWLSRDCVRGGGLEPAWKRYLGDRQVRTALLGVLKPVNERLIDLVGEKVRALEPKEIGDAIARLGIHIDAPVPPPPDGPPPKSVKLADLITAGLLKPPLRFFRRYKGIMLEAKLLPNGDVEFQETHYATHAAAAVAAMKSVVGKKMAVDAWIFWQVEGDGGKPQTLKEVRAAYLKS